MRPRVTASSGRKGHASLPALPSPRRTTAACPAPRVRPNARLPREVQGLVEPCRRVLMAEKSTPTTDANQGSNPAREAVSGRPMACPAHDLPVVATSCHHTRQTGLGPVSVLTGTNPSSPTSHTRSGSDACIAPDLPVGASAPVPGPGPQSWGIRSVMDGPRGTRAPGAPVGPRPWFQQPRVRARAPDGPQSHRPTGASRVAGRFTRCGREVVRRSVVARTGTATRLSRSRISPPEECRRRWRAKGLQARHQGCACGKMLVHT